VSDKQLATATQPHTLATQESPLNKKAHELALRIKYMIINGSKLADPEVFALAQYAAATDLNPFAQECYYLPGTGPVPGIAGWRKKANEQLVFEARDINFREPVGFWVDIRPCEPGEANFDPEKGDIAYHVALHDTLTRQRWMTEYFFAANQFMKMGMNLHEASDAAKLMIGEEPVKTGVGVVFANEKFTRDGGTEKYDRHERAQKRAEKLAIRKRFQRIDLHEPEGVDVDDVVDIQFNEQPRMTEAQIMGELYEGKKATSDITGDAPEKDTTQLPIGDQRRAKWPEDKISLKLAESITTSDTKEKYLDLPIEKLTVRYNVLVAKLEKNSLTPEQRAENELKHDVAKLIIDLKI
jgi:hypothetical protein